MECCTNIQDLGCFDLCEAITVDPAVSPTEETYTADFSSGAKTIRRSITLTEQSPMSGIYDLVLSGLDAFLDRGVTYIVKFWDEDGDVFSVTESYTTYDCFKITITDAVTN